MSGGDAPWVRVQLLGVPVEVHHRFGEHQDSLRRELDLIELAHAPDGAPARLHALGRELTGRYGALADEQTALLRQAMVELAWFWLRHQPGSALSQWFQQRVGQARGRVRRIAIVALARKLLVALWRYVTQGVVPHGAVVKA